MKARTRNAVGTLFLLATLVVVAGVAFLGVQLRGEEQARNEAEGTRALHLAPGAVRGIRLEGKAGAVRLARGEGGWRVVEPLDAPADAAAVTRLLEAVATLDVRGVSAATGAPGEVLARFGLDAPAARLALELEDGRTETLELGATTGAEGAMFVRPTDGRVLVVAGHERAALEPGLAELLADPPGKTGG